MVERSKREKRVEVRLNEKEYEKLVRAAEDKGVAIAEMLRDFVKSLPG